MSAIRRDFLPEHLAEEIARAGIDGTIAVQAGDLAETEWLLDLANQWSFIRGVVGWVPFHVFCQALSAENSSPAFKAKVFGRKIPIRLGTGQQLATVAQTSIRGLVTARTCVVAGLPRT
jgi:predicted TIM-barrel fold metal-dependent hydrolase